MNPSQTTKVLHIITGLSVGGAETILSGLVAGYDRSRFSFVVVSLGTEGYIGDQIRVQNVPVISLGMIAGIPDPRAVIKLVRIIRNERPQIVQTWMYHADFLGGIAGKFFSDIPVVWGIHHANPRNSKFITRIISTMCARLSKWLPRMIVVCSESALTSHAEFGYYFKKLTAITNGVDTSKFVPNRTEGESLRQQFGIGKNDIVIGHIGRWDKIKDYRTLISAAGILNSRVKNVHYLLIGNRISVSNSELVKWMRQAGVENIVHLLGERTDLPKIINCFDFGTLSSVAESFGLSIVETMACGIPCVVTDVGELPKIVGNTGKVVPARNPLRLAEAWNDLIQLRTDDRLELGKAARQRIIEHFSLVGVVTKYEKLYEDLTSDVRHRRLD